MHHAACKDRREGCPAGVYEESETQEKTSPIDDSFERNHFYSWIQTDHSIAPASAQCQ
jgi:hypothetical protein